MPFDVTTIFAKLSDGGPSAITPTERSYLNILADRWISRQLIPSGEEGIVYTLLSICNAVYNNFPNTEPVISDDKYDRIMVICKNMNIKVPVGAIPLNVTLEDKITNSVDDDRIVRDANGLIEIVRQVPDVHNRMFFQPMVTNKTMPMKEDFEYIIDDSLVSRKQRTTGHTYNLCGTLDKCKYVLNSDAQANGALVDGTVSIFERDFFQKHVYEGIINPNRIEVVCSLKYDGVSIENTVDGDEIISSLTRGDMNINEATDMSPVFSGMKYPRARGIQKSKPFGLKCEYIITNDNLELVKKLFKKEYVNPRNAVIGLTGGLDARKYRDFLTPIPLETSLDMDRISEIEFMNQYYTKGIDFRYVIIRGDYNEVLFMIRKFVQEAESLREYMPFIYDGVVVEYIDPAIRKRLGKRGSIPRYAIAIKFDPMRRTSVFTHYTYSVGQDGVIVPMAHFEPVDFFGARHSKTTAHSYERFKTLGLHVGDKVTLTLINDVIVYIRRAPEDQQDQNNTNPLVEFPDTCPSCGQPLYVSESEASVFCANFWCPERSIARLTNCLKKLSLKDFSTETIRLLGVLSLTDLYMYDKDEMDKLLGLVFGPKLRQNLEALRVANLPDYRLIGSLGFTNLANKTWNIILEQVTFEDIMNSPDDQLQYLKGIKGIGEVAVETIINERKYFLRDLHFIYDNFIFSRTPKYDPNKVVYKVRFTGIRDSELTAKFKALGFDADPDAGVTKDITILVVPAIGFISSKVTKVFGYLANAYAKAYKCPKPIINWQNLNLTNGLTPYVMTVDQASEYCESLLREKDLHQKN